MRSGFRAAIDRYVPAVEVADRARREWDKLDRALVRTMDRLERAAATFADALG